MVYSGRYLKRIGDEKRFSDDEKYILQYREESKWICRRRITGGIWFLLREDAGKGWN